MSKNQSKRKKLLAHNKKIIEQNKKKRIPRSELNDMRAWSNTHPSIWDKKEDPVWDTQAKSRSSDFGDNSLGSERTHYNKKRFIEQKKLEKKQQEIDIKAMYHPDNKRRNNV
tara:strand:+ start:329 stop:664 length:336 start_codon:yes stop_codon:yes gene_type:complete